ncbi:hypothetical protein ACRAWF_19960 [Streptomyces sp. L7]
MAGQYVGSAASDTMEILLLTSLFAALLAFHNAISRYLFSLGRQGDAPAILGRSHSKHGSPHAGSLVQSVSAAVVVGAFVLAGSDPVLELFTWMSGLATLRGAGADDPRRRRDHRLLRPHEARTPAALAHPARAGPRRPRAVLDHVHGAGQLHHPDRRVRPLSRGSSRGSSSCSSRPGRSPPPSGAAVDA